MNDGTIVAVCGYAGDAHQIRMMLPYYLHHRCPVLILSPSDSMITASQLPLRKELGFRCAGKRAYTGQDSLDRQIEHLKILLQFPPEYKYFLVHDSDSVVLSSVIPQYLFNEPDVVWSNIVSDAMHDDKRAPDYAYPHLAFQPPYFLSRKSIMGILSVAEQVKADSNTPFIDWAMMAWTVRAGLPYKNYPDGASCPTEPGTPPFHLMKELVERHGRYIIHSVKRQQTLKELAWARIAYLKRFKKG